MEAFGGVRAFSIPRSTEVTRAWQASVFISRYPTTLLYLDMAATIADRLSVCLSVCLCLSLFICLAEVRRRLSLCLDFNRTDRLGELKIDGQTDGHVRPSRKLLVIWNHLHTNRVGVFLEEVMTNCYVHQRKETVYRDQFFPGRGSC